MNPLPRLAGLGILALLSVAPAMGQRTYDCGNLNQPACGHSDWERVNMVAGDNRACEHDLANVDGTCRNIRRNTSAIRNPFWAGWALENQTLGIGKDVPINFITWPTSHNAYSTSAQGFGSDLYTNHAISMTDQMNAGARMLELDPKRYLMLALPTQIPISDVAIRLCHASSVLLCVAPGYGNRLFGFALKEIADWVDANPGQVLYIKLDNDRAIGGRIQEIYDEVQRYLGHRVYTVPDGGFRRWPTLGEIRAAGKSIIVVQHNTPGDVATKWVWKAIGLVQQDNHPKDQDFDNCKAYDGMDQIQRGATSPLTWWDVAEGRAKTNTGNADTGLLWEENVRKATRCGVASIGLDFINALNSSYNIKRSTEPDRRMAAMIWSWAENDWGRGGPAVMNAEGRWNSVAANNVYPVACAVKRVPASTIQDREWRITAAEIPWNQALANEQCVREFGSNYEFGAPENGYQNRFLYELAGGRRVWLRYSNVNVPNLTVSTTSLVFRMNPGGPRPAPQNVLIAAAPGTVIGSKFDPNLPLEYNLPANALEEGTYLLSVGMPENVSNLAPGIYDGQLDLGITNQGITIKVRLIVKAAPQITVITDPAVAAQGQQVVITVRLTNGQQITGPFKIYRTVNAEGIPTPFDTAAAGQIQQDGATGGVAKFDVRDLPFGTNTYVADYAGNAFNLGANSEPFQVTITPRIVANPAAVVLQYSAGGSLPAQPVTFTGLGANPQATASCDWLKLGWNGNTLVVATGDGVRTLPVGPTNCTVTVRDSLTQQGLGSLQLPVTVYVQTTLTLQPDREMTLLGEDSAAGDVQLGTASETPVDVTFTANVPWLLVQPLDGLQAPGAFRIVVDGRSLAVGQHRGDVTFSSTSAASRVLRVVFDKVRPTVVTTEPAGLPFVVDGKPYVGTASFLWAPNTVHQFTSNTVTQNGVRNTPKDWVSGSTVQPGTQFQLTAQANGGQVMARFHTFYYLTINGTPGGAVRFNPYHPESDGYFAAGSTVEVEAMPQPGNEFVEWLGTFPSKNRVFSFTMNNPVSLIAQFRQLEATPVSIAANVGGATAVVDGVVTPLPAEFRWAPGSVHTIAAGEVVGGEKGTRDVFLLWSNGGGQTQTITTPPEPLALTATYGRSFLVTVTPSPAAGGTVGGSGWYTEGLPAMLTATPYAGYLFSGFSGDLTTTESTPMVRVMRPMNIVANFTPAGDAVLKLVPYGARTDGPGKGQRVVPFLMSNAGPGAAVGARITGISGIRVMAGSGVVRAASTMPVSFGGIAPGAAATGSVVFDWPATATRVQFSVSYQSDNGAPGIATFNLFR
jgi:hypothetical protein